MSSTLEQVKGKLLIVDDEAAIRWALKKTLQNPNLEIVEAESAQQAIALVRTVRFDALLLDIGMPGMNGIEACRRIRELMPLLGIVMLTVRDTEEDMIQALDAGADDYVTKPFHARELAARLRVAVRRARASRPDEGAAIVIGEIELDPERRVVKKSGAAIHLTPKEFDLLRFLMSHSGTSACPRAYSCRGVGTGIRWRAGISPNLCPPVAKKARRRRPFSQIPGYRSTHWLPFQGGS